MAVVLQRMLQGGKAEEDQQTQTAQERDLLFNRRLKVATNQVLAVAQQLSVSIEENQEFSTQVLENAERMARWNREAQSEFQLMTEKFHDLVQRLDKIGGLSNEMERTGRNAELVLHDSRDEILRVVSDIHRIHQSAQLTLEKMNELQELSGAITGILETVVEISRQSQLLSFNASIEAARAGRAGAGFGVVAERIKQLSNDSKEAVTNIQELLDRIGASHRMVSQQMESTAAQVAESVRQFERVEENLARIEQSYGEMSSKNQAVFKEVTEEREKTLVLREQVATIQAKSEQSVQGVEVVYRGLKKHRGLVEELNDLGSRLNQSATALQPLISGDSDSLELKTEYREKAREMIRLLKQAILANRGLGDLNPSGCAVFLQKLLQSHPILEAAWINDPKGRFVHSIPAAGIANAKVREWFTQAMTGKEFITTPYISAITGKPCLTVAVPITAADSSLRGVLGVDLQC